MTPPVLVVGGPTASGKTDLALFLARELGGEIVAVDSAQVYRGLDVGTAKTPPGDRRGVPHHLLDVVDPAGEWNVALFRKAAVSAIADIRARGRLPVLAGGTSLYVTHLLHGLIDAPEPDAELRAELESRPSEELRAELTERDPSAAARIHPNDRFRTIRALEVARAAGRPLSEIQGAHGYADAEIRALILVPAWPRDMLYARIDARTTAMVQAGLVDETRTLVHSSGWDVRALDFIGYAEAAALLRTEPELSGDRARLDRLTAEIAQATRRFAKRQLTFWRNEPRKRGWLVVEEREIAPERLVGDIRARLNLPFPQNEVWYLSGAALQSTATVPARNF